MTDATRGEPRPDRAIDPRAQGVVLELERLADPARAAGMTRYFQAVPGGYGEGDRFWAPACRRSVASARPTPGCHWRRSTSCWPANGMRCGWPRCSCSVVRTPPAGPTSARRSTRCTSRTARINNWDRVDASADHVVGPHLEVVGDAILDRLAASPLVWERRRA